MAHAIAITRDALRDLDDIHSYIASQDGLVRADGILDRIQTTLAKLARFPQSTYCW